MDILNVYKSIFKTSKIVSIFSYEILEPSLKVQTLRSGHHAYFYIFNACFLIGSVAKQAIILLLNLMSPTATEIEIILQNLYLIGSIFVGTLIINQLIYSKQMANLMSMLIRLDDSIFKNMNGTELTKKNVLLVQNFQIQLVHPAWFIGYLAVIMMYYLFPKFPVFLYYFVPSREEGGTEAEGSWIIPAALGVIDTYEIPFSWANMISFDIFVGTFSSQMLFYLQNIQAIGTTSEKIRLFKCFQIIMAHMNEAYSNGLVAHMASGSAAILLLIYGALQNTYSLFLLGFFFSNALFLLIRIIYLLFPLATIQSTSEEIIKQLEVDLSQVKKSNLLQKMEIASIQKLCVSSGGVYTIDYHCVFNYLNFLMAYIVIIITV